MSKSNHVLALLPLFSLLTMSPMELEARPSFRSIASLSEVVKVTAAHPKYEARASKIDRSKIEIDKDLDLSCFSDRGEALRERLMTERKEYKVDVTEKEAVALQKLRLDSLVSEMVSLEEDYKALQSLKAFLPVGEEIASNTLNELKTTLESLLIDELENDFIVLKDQVKKEKEDKELKEDTLPPVVVEGPVKSTDEQLLCDLEDKNKVLTKQVEDLLNEQKKILETMLGMSNMMLQMNQQMQQPRPQYGIPSWMMSGSLVNPQLQYPYLPGQGAGSWVYYPQAYLPMALGSVQQPQQPQNYAINPQMGQQTVQQAGQYLMPNPYQEYDSRYSAPQPIIPGAFGNEPFSFNFGEGIYNQLPILTA